MGLAVGPVSMVYTCSNFTKPPTQFRVQLGFKMDLFRHISDNLKGTVRKVKNPRKVLFAKVTLDILRRQVSGAEGPWCASRGVVLKVKHT